MGRNFDHVTNFPRRKIRWKLIRKSTLNFSIPFNLLIRASRKPWLMFQSWFQYCSLESLLKSPWKLQPKIDSSPLDMPFTLLKPTKAINWKFPVDRERPKSFSPKTHHVTDKCFQVHLLLTFTFWALKRALHPIISLSMCFLVAKHPIHSILFYSRRCFLGEICWMLSSTFRYDGCFYLTNKEKYFSPSGNLMQWSELSSLTSPPTPKLIKTNRTARFMCARCRFVCRVVAYEAFKLNKIFITLRYERGVAWRGCL